MSVRAPRARFCCRCTPCVPCPPCALCAMRALRARCCRCTPRVPCALCAPRALRARCCLLRPSRVELVYELQVECTRLETATSSLGPLARGIPAMVGEVDPSQPNPCVPSTIATAQFNTYTTPARNRLLP